MESIIKSMPYILKGMGNTLILSSVCLAISVIAGILTGIFRTSNNGVLRSGARVFITVFRGIPSLVILYMVFFVLPEIGIKLDSFPAAVIGLSVWGVSNVGECMRGAIESLPKSQFEASESLGLSFSQTMIFVILPQAFRRIMPSLVGIASNMIQNTALTVFIGNTEFLKSAQYTIERIEMMEKIPVSFIIYAIVLTGYFIICFPLSMLSKKMEKRLNA